LLPCVPNLLPNSVGGDNKTETVIKMGLLVNFANGTVMGFGTPARIKKADTISVNFVGDNGSGSSVQGTVDRMTGSVIACTQLYSASSKKLITGDRWDLHCTPAGALSSALIPWVRRTRLMTPPAPAAR
jgi:hypothetical protein